MVENLGGYDWNLLIPKKERGPSLLTYAVHLEWKEKPNDPDFLRQHPRFRKKVNLFLDLIINPNTSGRIIIIYPGLNESINGLNQRNQILAYQMQASGLGAVVRGGNPRLEQFLPVTNLKKMVDYTLNNSQLIADCQKPEILMMGFSAGASAIATLASSYREISRILLIAPSGDMPRNLVKDGLEKFLGEVYIVTGANDEVVGPQAGQIYYDLATSSSHKELFVIPNCGHFFRGEINDNIFKKAPFYAFTQGQKPQFP